MTDCNDSLECEIQHAKCRHQYTYFNSFKLTRMEDTSNTMNIKPTLSRLITGQTNF